MKIAVINSMDNGSTGNIALNCVRGTDIEYKFFVGRKYLDNEANLFTKKWERGGHSILSQLLDVDEQCSRIATRRLIKELRKFNPDIIHLHNLHGYYVNYVMLFKYIKSIDVKVVWTLHDCWAFTGHCAHFDYIGCNKWKTHCEHCPNLKQYPSSKLFDRSKKLYKTKMDAFTGVKDLTIVCPSNWLARLVKQSFLKDYPIKTIYNGIDFENFNNIDCHTFDNCIDRTKKTILAVSFSWSEMKGYNDIIKLSNMLSNGYQVVMVGVSDILYGKLQNTKIIPIKRTENQKQLAELYSLASVYINPTYQEVLGLVNLEAQACGCPVITYNTGGSIETISNKSAIIVDKGDIQGIINNIENAENLSKNSNNYMSWVKENFSISRMRTEYNKLYKRQ